MLLSRSNNSCYWLCFAPIVLLLSMAQLSGLYAKGEDHKDTAGGEKGLASVGFRLS